MRPDDAADRDGDDFDTDEVETPGPESPGPVVAQEGALNEEGGALNELDAELDEELLEAELGEHDFALADELEEELDRIIEADETEDDEEDEFEMALLQEMGIDLDAAEGPTLETDFSLTLHEDDPQDEEVAA